MKILVDHMNFIFISFHMAKTELISRGIEEFTEKEVGFFYHVLFNKYNQLFKTYGQSIICHEGKGSLDWRREIFPDYKRNRDAGKQEESYLVLKSTFNKIEEVLNSYPCKQIKVDKAEGDDVIYALAKLYGEQGEEVVVISTDGDLAQILDISDTISIYNPIKKTFAQKKPNIVKQKAIVGDPSDNIPGLYRVGIKTFEKMIEDKKLWNEKMKGDNYNNYQKFLKIVDLSLFPKEYQDNILKAEKELNYNTFDVGKIEYFFYENAMQDNISRWGDNSNEIMERLIESGVKINGFMESTTKNSKDEELDDFLSEFI
jgi:5'-3' exonuclease